MKYDIFISYRRDGGDTLSQLLYDRLTHRGYKVFLDIESLNSGKFNEKLLDVIEECKDMVVVLPPNALDRCFNEEDWLYREVKHGIAHRKNIVPVMMKGFKWPEILPEAIQDLQNYNGIQDNKDYFDAVIDKLTTHLTSRPSIRLHFTGKKKVSYAEKKKRHKNLLFGAVACVCIFLGAFGIFKYSQTQKMVYTDQMVTIYLTPQEEVSASEYYDAVEIIEKRFDILAEGYSHSFEVEEDTVTVTVPMDVFHDIPIEKVLKCYVTRPTELYFTAWYPVGEEEYWQNSIHIDRSMIESVELDEALPEDIDLTGYEIEGIENPEDARCFTITFSEDASETLEKWEKEKIDYSMGVTSLTQDFGEFESNSYYYMVVDEKTDDHTIVVLDNYQYDNFLKLIQYNYTNETFSKAFRYNIELPVDWESEEDEMTGVNQCRLEELKGTKMRLDYITYQKTMTDGEFLDTLRIFKKRLDCLNMPYAFGYRTDGEYNISIMLNPAYLNDYISDLIVCDGGIEIRSDYYNIISEYSMELVEIIQKDDGSYRLKITPDEYSLKELNGNVDDMLLLTDVPVIEDTDRIYLNLSSNDRIMAWAKFEDSYDGTSFVFDGIPAFGLENVVKEHEYLLQLEKTVIEEPSMPYPYELDNTFVKDKEEGFKSLISEESISTEMKQSCETYLSKQENISDYTVEVDNLGHYISMNIHISDSENYAEELNQTIKKIYEECILNYDVAFTTRLCIYKGTESNKYFSISFEMDTYYHDINFDIFEVGHTDEEKELLYQIINQDEFYKQFYIDEFDLDEQGNIEL